MAGLFRVNFLSAAASAAAATPAATAATRVSKVLSGWNPAQLDGGPDVFADFLLEHLKLTLSGEEITGYFIFKQRIAGAFKLANFRSSKFDSSVLLVMEFLTSLMDALVLQAGGIVAQKALDVCLKLEK
jgi:hypothetical protein